MNPIKAHYMTPEQINMHKKNIREQIEKNNHERRIADIQKRIDLYVQQRQAEEQRRIQPATTPLK